MPGIAGIISREPPSACRRRLAAMVESMRYEPGYVSGTCEAPHMGVYAGWVAHPGSFAATESGTDAAGAVDLAFAGECFQDDSGRLLRLYERLGEDWVGELNGLFSGILVDRHRGRTWLFNDRYGVERIYVHEGERATYFASEAKALLRVVAASRAFDEEGVGQFLAFGCPLGGRTLFRGIRTLEGGSLWTFDGGSCRKRRYFTPSHWESQSALTSEDFQSAFESSFKRALPRYLRGESRVGISLTGGLDTRMIMACLPQLATAPVCYTFAGLQGQTVDSRVAARVASECGLEHRLLRIGPDFLSDYPAYLDRTVYASDACAGAVGAHELYLNVQARRLAPLRLTGNFGGEVLRRASTFKAVGLSRELIAADFRAQVAAAADDALTRPTTPVTFAAFTEIPTQLFGTLAAARSQLTLRTPYLDNDLVALAYRAPASVRRSSACAARVIQDARPRLGRIPTDRAVVAEGRGFAYRWRRLLAELTFKLDYLHQDAPPRWLMLCPGGLAMLDWLRHLRVHRYLPYRLWFQNELADYVSGALNDPATRRLPFWDARGLGRIAAHHVEGTRNYVREINAVLTLATADRLFVRGNYESARGQEDVTTNSIVISTTGRMLVGPGRAAVKT